VSLIDNERTKLTAAWLNGLATAAAAAGALRRLAPGAGDGHLDWCRVRLASGGEAGPREIATMNTMEWIGFVIAPLALLGAGWLVVYLTGRDGHRGQRAGD